MTVLTMILLVLAFVLFFVAAIGVATGRYNLIAAGLASWVLSELLSRAYR